LGFATAQDCFDSLGGMAGGSSIGVTCVVKRQHNPGCVSGPCACTYDTAIETTNTLYLDLNPQTNATHVIATDLPGVNELFGIYPGLMMGLDMWMYPNDADVHYVGDGALSIWSCGVRTGNLITVTVSGGRGGGSPLCNNLLIEVQCSGTAELVNN
jgi:hypothetical protein